VGTNLRKNRTDVPAEYHAVTFDAIATLQYPVAGKTRSSWTPDQLAEIAPFEGVAVTVTGYMAALKPQTGGTGESTNCHWTHAGEVDWHIALTKSAKEGEPGAIVVETTPRVRKDHPNWTPAALKPWVKSTTHTTESPVRISGWLMMDPEHRNHLGRYRTTLWEVHPITKIEVFQSGAWVNLDAMP
jgi:hypothetical protein